MGEISAMYNDTVSVLDECRKPYRKLKNKKRNTRPGWSEYVAEYHAEAREDTKSCVMAGRPRQEPECEHKKLTNAKYKYGIGFICNN